MEEEGSDGSEGEEDVVVGMVLWGESPLIVRVVFERRMWCMYDIQLYSRVTLVNF